MTIRPYRPTPLEVASGLIFGFVEPEPLPNAARSPLEALEQAILPALLRPPCLVSFSGGRDSSTILAVAVQLARREGLALPIPATNRFPGAEGSDENEWQENVVVHLGLTDWVRFEFDGELDLVGPIAMRVLRRHGLLWPFNAHFHMPVIEEACGGSVITGVGGDEALGASRWARAAKVLAGRARPRARDVLAVSLAASPQPVRRAVLGRRDPVRLPWLRPWAQDEVWAAWTRDTASEPLRWAQRFAWWRRSRYVRLGLESLTALASDLRVQVHSPFVDPQFSAAMAALPADRRFYSRTSTMRELFGDLLPAEVLARRTKSHFDNAFWGDHSRAIAAEWEGDEVDPEVVDPHALRDVWSAPRPDARSFFLLQAVALAREGRSVARQLAQAVGSLA